MTTEYDSILEITNAYDHVFGNLYIGGILPSYDQFDTVICCTPDVVSHYNRTNKITCYVPFNDSSVLPSELFIRNAVELVLSALNRGTVLVHCSAGLNRSGLIVALTMMSLGWSSRDSVDHLRNIRSCSVLCNETFYNYVMSM